MIPLQLTLKNFLSYREASLDFSGLHTACICGANGAGKSSLLEAITWSIWGRSRATSEDDAIAHGAKDMRVDFTFQLHGSIYRIIRSRQLGGSGGLELQVMTDQTFKSLTQKGIKATQSLIDEYLKIDYDTFTNSAYLRQGKADEFMLKKPSERKQILADLLKLDRYEVLADRAKQVAAEYRSQALALEHQLTQSTEKLQEIPALITQSKALQDSIDLLQTSQTADQTTLDTVKTTAQQRATYQQQIQWSEQRQQELQQDLVQIQQELARTSLEIDHLAALLARGAEIASSYANYERLSAAVADWENKARAHQQTQTQIQEQQLQIERQKQRNQLALERLEQSLENAAQQQQEQEALLATAPEVEKALAQLQISRNRLRQLDEIHRESTGITKRRQDIQAHIDRLAAQQQARLEQLHSSIAQSQTRMKQQDAWIEKLKVVEKSIATLDKQRVYLDRIRDKGQDCSGKLAQIEIQRKTCKVQQQKLAEKLATLESATDAACPLCSYPLDGDHWQHFLTNHEQENQELEQQLSDLQEQEINLNRDRDKLRQEYQEVTNQLKAYDKLSEEKGRLNSQLAALVKDREQLQELQAERENLVVSLADRLYAKDFLEDLQELDDLLKELGYDEKNHALARSEADRYRWAEIRQSDLKKAAEKRDDLHQRQQEIQQQLGVLHQQSVTELTQSESKFQELQMVLGSISYDANQQQQDQEQFRQLVEVASEYRQWQQAQINHPQLLERAATLREQQQGKLASYQQAATDSAEIARLLAALPDNSTQLVELEKQMLERRQQIDGHLATLGQLTEKLWQLEGLQESLAEQQAKLQEYKQQQLIHDELTKAFGRNGIQALIVENILPQIEVEANNILSRLSNHQFNIQFITQKHTKKSIRAKKSTLKNAKPIDTLDIVIGDANGTRPYENYSGGEAFRINFSIRLALAKLLSQRSGTPLQMLVVDEGFGTQDREGCDRLIAAIDAISSDFKCVLAVTHMPQFREAFQTRIEVHKTADGSQIEVFS
jgi:DNA repair protein SbcC/Rad50